MNMQMHIYTLEDDKNEVRYVGVSKNPQKRLYQHIHRAKSGIEKNHKSKWIKSLLKKDQQPLMRIIDSVPFDEWITKEIFYIKKYKELGCNLVNLTDGGEGTHGHKLSQKHKEKLRKISTGRIPSQAQIDKMKKIMKGRKPKNLVQIITLSETKQKKILQYDLEGKLIKEWRGIAKTEKTLGITNLSRLLRKKWGCTIGGFIWRYEHEPLTLEELQLIKRRLNKQKKKPVLQYSLDGKLIKEWESYTEVKKFCKHAPSVIYGQRKTACGFIWKYK